MDNTKLVPAAIRQMPPGLNVRLVPDEYEALLRLARDEDRGLREQAARLIREGLRGLGRLPAKGSE